jgi:uncharacterized coiled-coil DUF342 family protein
MNDNKPSGKLPTELIDEKTFYTLGGASAAVLLICWAINYVAIDVSWLNYKMYRLIGIILSETFAITIMLQKKDRKKIQWLFTFLNGLLIFVNASGLNIMTSSYIFNPSDSSGINKTGYFHSHQFKADAYQQAGIFPLPRMINWWPDEKLIEQNNQLAEKNHALDSVNYQLRILVRDRTAHIIPAFPSQTDSLQLLQSQLTGKQKQIDELNAALRKNGNELQHQLASCLKQQADLHDSIQFYANKFISCERSYSSLSANDDKLRKDLTDCNNQLKLLTGQLNGCTNEKASLQKTIDALNATINDLKRKLKNSEDQLNSCTNDKASLQKTIATLNATINDLKQRLKNQGDQNVPKETTLTELIRQVCLRNERLKSITPEDASLRRQQFYIKMNWPSFCKAFNAWENAKNTIIE